MKWLASTVANEGSRTTVGLTFVSTAEVVGSGRPVQVVNSNEWSVALAPAQSVALGAGWLTSTNLDRLLADAAPPSVQLFIAPATIRFSDGSGRCVHVPPTVDARAIRRKLTLTQRTFTAPVR